MTTKPKGTAKSKSGPKGKRARKPIPPHTIPKRLTPKQDAFCRAYIETGNASEAYRRAYNAEKTKPTVVAVKASELLKTGNVSVRIAELQAGHRKRHEVTVDRIIEELAKIGFSDIRNVVKWGEGIAVTDPETDEVKVVNGVSLVASADLDDRAAACISEVTQSKDGALRIKLHDKRAALVDMGKHLGMFKDVVEHTGKDGGPIETAEISDLDMARRVAFMLGRASLKRVDRAQDA